MTKEQESDQSNLGIVSTGAIIYFIGMAVNYIARFLLNVILTRSLGTALYGTYSYSRTIIDILKVIGRFGSTESLMKFVPEKDSAPHQSKYFTIALFTSFVGSTIIGIVLYVVAPIINNLTLSNEYFVEVLRFFSIFLPPTVTVLVIAGLFRAISDPKFQIGIKRVLFPVFQLLFISIAIIFDMSFKQIILYLSLSAVFSAIIALGLLYYRTNIRISSLPSFESIRGYYNFSLPLTLTAAGSILYTRVDLLMVGYLLTDSDVGIYNVAILLSTFIGIALTGLNQLFPPIASDLHSKGSKGELNKIYSQLTRWAFTMSLILAILCIAFSPEIMNIFGPNFRTGYTVLSIFALGQIIRNGVGPSGYMLMMTEHQYLVMINRWVLGISNVVLNYILIINFGFIGAAVGSAASLAVINSLRLVQIYSLEGYFPYTKEYFKPIVSGLASLVPILLISEEFESIVSIFIGAVVGASVYCSVLYLLGIPEEDRKFMKEYIMDRST